MPFVPSEPKSEQTTRQQLGNAVKLLKTGNITDATELINSYLEADPSNKKALILAGKIALKNRDFKSANNYFLKADNSDPFDATIKEMLARAQVGLKDDDKAIELLKTSIDIDNSKIEAISLLCKLYYKKKRYDDVINCLESVHAYDPYNPKFANTYANSLIALNQVDAAIKYLKLTLSIHSDDTKCWDTLHEAYAKNGDVAESISCLDSALKECEKDDHNKLLKLRISKIELLLDNDNFNQAISEIKIYKSHTTDNSANPAILKIFEPRLMLCQGQLFAGLGEFSSAIESMNAAINLALELDSTNSSIHSIKDELPGIVNDKKMYLDLVSRLRKDLSKAGMNYLQDVRKQGKEKADDLSE